MEICDVFSMDGIENNPASGDIFLENVILKVSQTHFSRISIPRGGIHFSRGGNAPPPRGGCEVPCLHPHATFLTGLSGRGSDDLFFFTLAVL